MSLFRNLSGREMLIAFPHRLAQDLLPLLHAEVAELEAVFGTSVRFVEDVPDLGPRWIVNKDSSLKANCLEWDAATSTLTSYVRDAAGLGSTLQLLHSMVALDRPRLCDSPSANLGEAIVRIDREVARGFPGLGVRQLDWDAIRAEYPPSNEMTLDDLQRMIARLQDGHTAVRQNVPVYNPPYAVELREGRAILRRISEWSQAAAAGIMPGWELVLDDIDGWLARTGAPPHALPLIAGRRAIALNGVAEREFVVRSPDGEERSWLERAEPFSLDSLISASVVADDIVYVRMHNWIEGVGLTERFLRILQEYRHRSTLVLDLRGNTGGNLLMAQQLRRCFLRERTNLGTIQFTQADGTLAEPVELWDDPHQQVRWAGELVVLTDALTFSASEDFLQGLQGLPHVTVLGERSGGGSGRPRTLPLIPGWSVSVSTALTFDRTGHCIEGQGIPVDALFDPYSGDWKSILGI